MWRHALAELRLRPGQFAATWAAIALSVSFLVALSAMVRTEIHAMAMQATVGMSKADLVVTARNFEQGDALLTTVRGVEGVTAAIKMDEGESDTVSFDGTAVFVRSWVTPPEEFRWAELREGRYPQRAGELALSESARSKLGAKVGDVVETGQGPARVVGITDDARALTEQVVYSATRQWNFDTGTVLARVDGDPRTVGDRILAAARAGATVELADDFRTRSVDDSVRDLAAAGMLGWVFGGLALIIGGLIIANTFTILGAQRRRQVALLRAVGASPGQVLGRLLVEGLLVGVVGAVGGVVVGLLFALVGALITGSVAYGLQWHVGDWLWPVVVGVALTVLAAVAPSVRASLVRPLEALQTVPTPRERRVAGTARLVVGVLLLAGGALCFVASRSGTYAAVWAVGALGCLGFAMFVLAPFYVAPFLRLMNRLLGRIHPTVRLALENAARNPRRAAATSVALILAVGVTVSLQTTLATVRESGRAIIQQSFPAEIEVVADDRLPDGLQDRLDALPAVRGAVAVPSKRVRPVSQPDFPVHEVMTVDAAHRALENHSRPAVADGIYLTWGDGTLVLPTTDGGSLSLKPSSAGLLLSSDSMAVVSEADFAKIDGDLIHRRLWVGLGDRTSGRDLAQVLDVLREYPSLEVRSDGASALIMLENALDIALVVLTVLLGVAVLIALVGVGNTLALSVLERQRESALLRAVGMQPGGLRTMLLVEALSLMIVGVGIGAAGGVFFVWMLMTSLRATLGEFSDDVPLSFGVDVGATALLLIVCAVAAALASILPGRKAASASPAEALTVE